MDTATDGRQQLHLLYRDHHGWLQGWLRKRLGDREHAADVAQDTFLRLLVSGRFPGAKESRSYLTQIAHLPEPESPSLETRALILETLMQIDAMLDRMPDNVRRAFLLSQFEGLSYAQIAERLEVTVSSVQKYMTRAILACYQVAYEE
ncbi:sigma factor-like helix-turn-helix DNA-binding protein [Pseudomonas sp. ADAK13]|uniref:sigma factor-like helix-turn-helix DNA-binding protein n=1 Tax=Pseudomonas sp. ADAK13 TaxID=2730847 RepID=UPI0014649508|nr:sigma factor-like helix-turn-helix DNA-binding protein [Pseudomonas sp. ADAK13]QJI34690.1 RNA polymerase subunit sigma [Pseudomonas sp. ADAK13]